MRLGGGACFLLTHFPVFDSEAVCEGVASPSPDGEEGRRLGAPTSAWTPEARLLSPAGKDRASQETIVCDDHGTCSGDDARQRHMSVGVPTSAWTPKARLSSPAGRDRASLKTSLL